MWHGHTGSQAFLTTTHSSMCALNGLAWGGGGGGGRGGRKHWGVSSSHTSLSKESNSELTNTCTASSLSMTEGACPGCSGLSSCNNDTAAAAGCVSRMIPVDNTSYRRLGLRGQSKAVNMRTYVCQLAVHACAHHELRLPFIELQRGLAQSTLLIMQESDRPDGVRQFTFMTSRPLSDVAKRCSEQEELVGCCCSKAWTSCSCSSLCEARLPSLQQTKLVACLSNSARNRSALLGGFAAPCCSYKP